MNKPNIQIIIEEMESLADSGRASVLQRFFKTGKGEYGEGDVFMGLVMPVLRNLAKKYYKMISLDKTQELLTDFRHEVRMTALLMMNLKFLKADAALQEKLFEMYISNTRYINNWDLVDLSAPNIVGNYLLTWQGKERINILMDFAQSDDLWKKRIAVLATFSFIRKNNFEHTIDIAETLLKDKHDLIHKAVGWMLREVGKRDMDVLRKFLDKHVSAMPRTMLRYAIEKFDDEERKKYLLIG